MKIALEALLVRDVLLILIYEHFDAVSESGSTGFRPRTAQQAFQFTGQV
jgi:hypothetical protein